MHFITSTSFSQFSAIFLLNLLTYVYLIGLIIVKLVKRDIKGLYHIGKSGWFSFALYIWASFFGILFLQPNKTHSFASIILTTIVALIWFGLFYIWLRFDYLQDSPKASKLVAVYSFSVLQNAYYWAKLNLAAQSMLFYTFGALAGLALGQLLAFIFGKNNEQKQTYLLLGFGLMYPVWGMVGMVGGIGGLLSR